MDFFRKTEVQIFLVIIFCVFISFRFFDLSFGPNDYYYDEMFELRTDSKRYFPVDENGVVIEPWFLSVEDQRKIYTKIKMHDPDEDAEASFRSGDFRFLAWDVGKNRNYVGLPCRGYLPNRVKFFLYLGYKSNAKYEYDIKMAWQLYATRYNRKLISMTKRSRLNECSVRAK